MRPQNTAQCIFVFRCLPACTLQRLPLVREPLFITGAPSSPSLILGGEGSDRQTTTLPSQRPGTIVHAADLKNTAAPLPTLVSPTATAAGTGTSLRGRFGSTDKGSQSAAPRDPASIRDTSWTTDSAAASRSPLRVTDRPVSAGNFVAATGDTSVDGKSPTQRTLSPPPRNHAASDNRRPSQVEETVLQGGLSPRLSSSDRGNQFFTPNVKSFFCHSQGSFLRKTSITHRCRVCTHAIVHVSYFTQMQLRWFACRISSRPSPVCIANLNPRLHVDCKELGICKHQIFLQKIT